VAEDDPHPSADAAERGSAPAQDADERAPERSDAPPQEGRPTPLTQQLGRILIFVVAVIFGIFAVANAQYVDFSWVFGETEVVKTGGERTSGGVPLIVLLVVAFALGALVGWASTWRRSRTRRRRSPRTSADHR
jgi:uncharacterized integral membrane protein